MFIDSLKNRLKFWALVLFSPEEIEAPEEEKPKCNALRDIGEARSHFANPKFHDAWFSGPNQGRYSVCGSSAVGVVKFDGYELRLCAECHQRSGWRALESL